MSPAFFEKRHGFLGCKLSAAESDSGHGSRVENRIGCFSKTSMNRRDFLKSTLSSATLLLAQPAGSAENERPAQTDDEILAQTRARIEKHRMGDGVIILRDSRGNPVSRARIKLEQTRHDFLFGCNFFMFGRNGDADREEKYRQQFAALLNYCTLGFYWAAYEPERGKPNYAYTDEVVEWCTQHGIACKGHPLVWDHPAGSPPWLPDDEKEIERLSMARVREIIARFKGRIDIWDVVNEATHLPEGTNKTKMAAWGKALGPRDYVSRHLRVAREANPAATLLVNDYRIDPPYLRILEGQRDHGKFLFDTVGVQSHMHGGVWPLQKVWDTCDTYAKLGLPIHFTETTIVSGPRQGQDRSWGQTTPEGEAKQAEQTAKFYTALFAHPAVQAITWWDFSDHGAWQRAPAGWLRSDESPKPVYERLLSLIKGEWWTKTEGQPNALGVFATRAFHGLHRVTVELPGGHKVTKEVHWQPGKSNKFEIEIA
jgi:endo-1,4-beta-xylanase